ncbi:MAG TPA: DUF72 domain-containing protein [Chthoniobacterales bacterium]|nr:DUF72 domain-containing protein [Chthoniobacterales bacterium]
MRATGKAQNGKILIGTASWSDPGFVEHWYPKKMPAHERLGWYARHFEMVEVNSTFYSIPDARTVERWCAATPNDFVFDVKLHQLFSFHSTQSKLLPPALQRVASTDAKGKVNVSPELRDAMLDMFVRTMSILHSAGKLGVFLLQLSPAFSPRKHQLDELEPVVSGMGDYSLAIEFRNRNWVVGDQLKSTLDFLRKRDVGFVNVDTPPEEHFSIVPSDLNEVTNSNFGYLRLHGRDAKAYLTGKTVAKRFDYDYSKDEIEEVAERSRGLAEEAKAVHVVFNNNNLDYAPRAAIRLRKALGQKVPPPPAETPELF